MTEMTLDQQIEEYLRFRSGVPSEVKATRLRERALRDFGRYCRLRNINSAAEMTSYKMSDYSTAFTRDGGNERMFQRHLIILIDFFIFAQKNGWTSVKWTECTRERGRQ